MERREYWALRVVDQALEDSLLVDCSMEGWRQQSLEWA